MKKLILTLTICTTVLLGFAQEKKETIKLGLFSSHSTNFEYLNGKVKEIHYKPFHLVEVNGEFKKGKLFTLAESQQTILRQPWSYFYNELGQLVKMSMTDDKGILWTGVVHHANNKIENIYWLKKDTILFNWDYVYPNNGRVERLWIMVQNNEVNGKYTYDLDKNGNVLKFIFLNKTGEIGYTWEYVRNPDGSKKSENGTNAEGKIMWGRDKYTYNTQGLLETLHHNIFNGEKSDRTSPKIEYKFDKEGNWIERKNPKWMVVEREIIYYD